MGPVGRPVRRRPLTPTSSSSANDTDHTSATPAAARRRAPETPSEKETERMSLAPERIGIGIRRHFTTAGVHPYDEVVWERRDARITNCRDGSVAFEQLDVEFPVDVVAQRHQHRRPEVLPGHPRHARAGVVAAPGRSTGWPTPSPRGASRTATSSTTPRPTPSATSSSTSSSPRRRRSTRRCGSTSACKGVPQQAQRLLHPRRRRHDGLDPQLVRRGGHHLQGRLGLGRQPVQDPLQSSSCSRAAARPRARSASCAAPTPRPAPSSRAARPAAPPRWSSSTSTTPTSRSSSGARPRRSSKARVLRDAGFDMDLDGADIVSIQYQNANNSVRVTDEFMQAVRRRRRLAPAGRHRRRGRHDGPGPRPLRQIAQAAGSAPIPACSSTPRSTAGTPRPTPGASTAPTRAGVHAPRQLGLQPGQPQPAQVPRRRRHASTSRASRHAVEVIFTAQEILVGNADYPTEPIGETSRAVPPARPRLRQPRRHAHGPRPALRLRRGPGLGRRPSPSLMTGHAYATSARTAGRMGPFAGFADNEEHMLRVLRHAPRRRRPTSTRSWCPADLLSRRPAGLGRGRAELARSSACATARPRCWPPPAPSA